MRRLIVLVAGVVLCASLVAEEADDAVPGSDAEDAASRGDGIESPRAMSGMSILGNEEAPKALVIIPWKSSELGDDISLEDTLDERARPVDKEVFLRELRYYQIRSGKSDSEPRR